MERKRIRQLFEQLQNQTEHPFPKPREGLTAPETHGVYVIRDRESTVLHVGRTVKGANGIAGRLADHLHNQSSFAKNYLKRNEINLRDGCTFQYLEVEDDRTRAQLEHLAIGELCPEHIGLGRDEKEDDAE